MVRLIPLLLLLACNGDDGSTDPTGSTDATDGTDSTDSTDETDETGNTDDTDETDDTDTGDTGQDDKDSDGDGLLDSEEKELGTDPLKADTDGDGRSDSEELTDETDPLDDDTDDDGFLDGEEYTAGTDPNAPLSYERTTTGRWPDLRSYATTTTPEGWDIGDRFKNFTATDQNGNSVELYQFWGNVVLLDFSAGWCGPCRVVAASAESEYRSRVNAGKPFVTVHLMINGNTTSGPPSVSFLKSWETEYGLTFPVVTSSAELDARRGMLATGLYQNGIPFMVLLDQEMVLVQAETGSGAERRLYATADRLMSK